MYTRGGKRKDLWKVYEWYFMYKMRNKMSKPLLLIIHREMNVANKVQIQVLVFMYVTQFAKQLLWLF